MRTGCHGCGDSGEDEEEGEDQLPQHGADAAGVDDLVLVERVHVLGGHGGSELHETSCLFLFLGGKDQGRGESLWLRVKSAGMSGAAVSDE
jgi:hypothetical protein